MPSEREALLVAATFSLGSIPGILQLLLEETVEGMDVSIAPYGDLILPLVRARTDGPKTALLLVRAYDLIVEAGREHLGYVGGYARLHDCLEALIAAVGAFAHCNGPCLIAPLPSPPNLTNCTLEGVRRVSDLLTVACEGTQGTHIIDVERACERYAVSEIHDPFADRSAHLPYTDEFLAAVATESVRIIRSIRPPIRKAVVLDCDFTLWGGACGEDGIGSVRLEDGYLSLQEKMVEQRASGRMLALCSRNCESDVRAVFLDHPEMPLRWSDFSVVKVNYESKVENLIEIAEEFGFATESLVFVDDDPVECAAVRVALPEIAVVNVPRDAPEIPAALDQAWALDLAPASHDALERADRFRQEQQRTRELPKADLSSFLAGLELTLTIREPKQADLLRLSELTMRTNQFNSTGWGLSLAEATSWLEGADTLGLIIGASDRYGDYGTIGVVLASIGRTVHVELIAISCRAFDRGIEEGILAYVAGDARDLGLPLEVTYKDTHRNGRVRRLLASLPTGRVISAGGTETWIFEAEAVSQTMPTHVHLPVRPRFATG